MQKKPNAFANILRNASRRPGRPAARHLPLGVLALLLVLAGSGPAPAQEGGFDLEEQEDFEVRGRVDEEARKRLTHTESEVELGFYYNSSNDEIFGNYNGFLDRGFYVLGDVDLWRRDLFGWGDDWSARLQGQNLGLQSRWIGAELGKQGRFGLFFEYDQLPVFRSETAETFFTGIGSKNLTLPEVWTPAGNPQAMPNLEENLRSYDIEWDRRRFSGGGSVEFTDTLGFDARYDYVTKKGRKLVAGMMGVTGGNPRSALIPEPLDLTTQQVDAALRYAGENLQLSLGYYGSFLNNDVDFLVWENPYTAATGWDPSAAYDCGGVTTDPGCGLGRKHSAPDNQFHQILASGGYSLPARTRVTVSTAFGWMLQDESFLPYSINSALTATTQAGAPTDGTDKAALPRRSLDGEIFTTVVDFRVSSRPIDKVDLGLGYHFDNRDNNTPRDTYFRIPADSASQDPIDDPDTGTARINLPYSFTQHQVSAHAGYEIWRRTNLKLGYRWTLTERDYQEVKNLDEHTVGATLTSQPWGFLGTRIRYAHSWFNGHDYVGNRPFNKGHTPEYAEAERATCITELGEVVNPNAIFLPDSVCAFENHPLQRKLYMADRERDEVKFRLTLTPREELSIGLFLTYLNEDYDDSEVGLTNVLNWGPGVDLSYTPFQRLTTHAFYSYLDFRTQQKGWSWSGNDFGTATNPAGRWSSQDQDETHTMGLGFDFGVIPGRLDLGADYVYAHSTGQVETTGPIPYPENLSKQQNVSLRTAYHFTENLSMRLGYLFAYWKRTDWALDGLGPASLNFSGNAAVIASGRQSEGYRAHVASWSMVYRFW